MSVELYYRHTLAHALLALRRLSVGIANILKPDFLARNDLHRCDSVGLHNRWLGQWRTGG